MRLMSGCERKCLNVLPTGITKEMLRISFMTCEQYLSLQCESIFGNCITFQFSTMTLHVECVRVRLSFMQLDFLLFLLLSCSRMSVEWCYTVFKILVLYHIMNKLLHTTLYLILQLPTKACKETYVVLKFVNKHILTASTIQNFFHWTFSKLTSRNI
jgi:hypothetical protein